MKCQKTIKSFSVWDSQGRRVGQIVLFFHSREAHFKLAPREFKIVFNVVAKEI